MRSSTNTAANELYSRQAWVSYRLQSLPASKMAVVVNRILSGDDILINPLKDDNQKKKS